MTSKLDTAGLVARLRTDAAYANDRIGSTIRAIGRDCAEAASQLSALQERAERAERGRDEAIVRAARQEDRAEAAEARVAELEAHLTTICKVQSDNYGDATATHVALIKPCDEARAALAHKGE